MGASESPDSSQEVLVLFVPAPEGRGEAGREQIDAAGGRVVQSYGQSVWIVELPPAQLRLLADDPLVAGVYDGLVPDDARELTDETGRLGIAAWNARHEPSFSRAKRARIGEGEPWDHPDFEREGGWET
ncbi:MAG TPA: hypothetical protein VGQ47_01630 [Candidatus Limnocylindrales bacterium]|jgi:hypothetical protein|nr:hypothetical protein [Candidatus Limnocylindrales bacterium]